jgi:hypothetical protein
VSKGGSLCLVYAVVFEIRDARQSQKLRLLPTNGQDAKLPYRSSGSFHVIGMEFLIGCGVGFSDSGSISTNGERDLHSDTD